MAQSGVSTASSNDLQPVDSMLTHAEAETAAASAASAATKPRQIVVLWEVTIQASSNSHLEVLDSVESVILNGAADVVSLRAASGDGATLAAQSAMDIVCQLSCQVSQVQGIVYVHWHSEECDQGARCQAR